MGRKKKEELLWSSVAWSSTDRLRAGSQTWELTAQDLVASPSLLLLQSQAGEAPATSPYFQAAPNLEVHFALEKGWTCWPPEVPSDLNYSKVILQSCWLFIVNYLTEEWKHCQEACKKAKFYYWQKLPLIHFLLSGISTRKYFKSISPSC